MTDPAIGALRDCVQALVSEVQRLDPGWAPPHVPDLPDDERPCAYDCADQGSHRSCPIHGDVAYQRTSLAPAPDYATRDTRRPLADPEPCGCEEAEALRVKLAKAERRAALWHRVARMKSRLLRMSEPPRCDSQLTRPVHGG